MTTLPFTTDALKSSARPTTARKTIATTFIAVVLSTLGLAAVLSGSKQAHAAAATIAGPARVERALGDEEFKPSTDFFTRQEFRGQFVSNSDFAVDINSLAPATGLGGEARTASVSQVPALWGEGIALVRLNLEPCGINLPHVHPRATEFTYVIEGENVQMSFVEENNGRLITNDVQQGGAAFFPKGLVHYQFNNSCKPAVLLAALGHEDFGTQTITTQAIRNFPTEGLAASLGITEEALAVLRDGFQGNPAQAAECAKRCGLA